MIRGDQFDEVSLLREQATALAGTTRDLAQRASVYHHLYSHSRGNHSFPLLAAHGALWASGYFRLGMRLGSVAAFLRGMAGADRKNLEFRLAAFAEAFRDINRRVCVKTFFIYWLTARPHLRSTAEVLIPFTLMREMDRCHAARMRGRGLSHTERRALFEAFFLWEQQNILGPSIARAFADFDWPFIRNLALRPKIDFSYFNGGPLAFRNFADTDERIVMGLRAFDRAAEVGWAETERSLADYKIMPLTFSIDPLSHFRVLIRSVLPTTDPSMTFA